jgi:hypothetical protein
VPSGILLTGRRFGLLRVLKEMKEDIYLCQCACSNKVVVFRSQLTHGAIRHCSCIYKKHRKKVGVTFGHYRTYMGRDGIRKAKTSAEFNSWRAMLNRCKYKGIPSYATYGGRGIAVCDRWLVPGGLGFINFLADMGVRPIGKSLDRKNPNGGYDPSNCQWADREVQGLNRRPCLWPHGVGEPPVTAPMQDMLEESLACG